MKKSSDAPPEDVFHPGAEVIKVHRKMDAIAKMPGKMRSRVIGPKSDEVSREMEVENRVNIISINWWS